MSHYELVVLGADEYSGPAGGSSLATRYNLAYEVTDCGIVVGQMNRQIAAVPVYQGFFYLDRPRFGRPAGHLEFLPALLPNGAPSPTTPSIARDVNAAGWIVGDMGQDPNLAEFFVPRAAAWRISDAPTPFVRAISPPQPDPQSQEPVRDFGWLGAVSEGDEPWAAFTFEGPFCGGPVPVVRFERVASVRLDLDAPPPLMRTPCLSCPEPDITSGQVPAGRLAAYGISPNGELLCGWRETCFFNQTCHGPLGLRARQWISAELCPNPPSCDGPGLLNCGTCLTPDPVQEPDDPAVEPGASARQYAVLNDGSAVGFVTDAWPELATTGGGGGSDPVTLVRPCGRWAYAWTPPVSLCGQPGEPDALCGNGDGGLYADASIGVRLPIPDSMLPLLRRSEAFDIERNPFTANGRRAGHFAVGDVATKIVDKPDPALRGLVWFAEGDQVSNWAVADINQMVSPTPPIEGYSSFVVRALRGVNTRGDAVGMAEFTPTDGTDPVRRAVLLRAVPSGLAGDLDGDGMVGASDLAILLGAWCTEAA
ncbi:MAG: hypothetical protein GC172_01980, partial [Phycisphaera sp.]|nr:hypothetical protein [Phycisphaera sp.]